MGLGGLGTGCKSNVDVESLGSYRVRSGHRTCMCFDMSALDILTASGQVIIWFALGKGPVSTYCVPPPNKSQLQGEMRATWLSQTGKMAQTKLPVSTELELLLFECKIVTKMPFCFPSLEVPYS